MFCFLVMMVDLLPAVGKYCLPLGIVLKGSLSAGICDWPKLTNTKD